MQYLEQDQKESGSTRQMAPILGSPLLTETQIVFTTETGNVGGARLHWKTNYTISACRKIIWNSSSIRRKYNHWNDN